ncbi:hypothetical protein VNI00_012578 [Paramarasmius palmivorus]|uniref:Uncharacterized protein n=1 Tax=Paramarasmius palmivorus TaxID=297713 RepID=A0AAW0C587_9AGAR
MSDRPPNFATTLSNGIQDIAALLPLLGTEQCEQHIGSALQKGFLYAAVAPLSIFGSLGIVKAAFAAMLATVTYPFYGGRWLDDAGFATPGSVSSMVTIAKDTGKYGAEVALGKLLKEQHIDDPTLVKGFSWLGWKEEDKGQRERNRTRKIAGDEDGDGYSDTGCLFSWNMMLIHCTLLCAILSVTPYLYVMSSHWDRPLSWIFPLLRSFGSFACVVATQLVLQLRIHRIANTSLQWLKLQRKYGFEDESHPSAQVLEDRIRQQFRLHPSISPFVHLSRQSTIDAEAGEGTDGSFANCPLEDEEILDLEERFAADWRLILYQFILAIGIGMVVTGYVGCFSLVAQSDVVNAPYVWLALETTLSVVRTFVWGSNPAWDESTGLKMTLELEPSTSKGVSETPFPLITSPHDEARLRIDTPQPFTAHNEADFLGMATAWVGPLQRLEPGSATLFYSILFQNKIKRLYTTVHFTYPRPTLTFSADVPDFEVYSSTLETDPTMRTVQVTLRNRILGSVDPFINSQPYHRIVNHSRLLSTRLFGKKRSYQTLDIRWNLLTVPIPFSFSRDTSVGKSMVRSKYDQAYIDLHRSWTSKSQYCKARRLLLEKMGARNPEYREKGVIKVGAGKLKSASFCGEVLLIAEPLGLALLG